MGYLTTALYLGFGIMFALEIGLYGIPEFADVLDITEDYHGDVTDQDANEMYRDMVLEWILPTLIGASVLLIMRTGGYATEMIVAAGAVAFMATKLLLPLSALTLTTMPDPLNYLVIGFLNILLLVGIFGFVRGVRP